MKIMCAWCGKIMGIRCAPGGDVTISICPSCVDEAKRRRMMREKEDMDSLCFKTPPPQPKITKTSKTTSIALTPVRFSGSSDDQHSGPGEKENRILDARKARSDFGSKAFLAQIPIQQKR